jgi:hypothetical protein
MLVLAVVVRLSEISRPFVGGRSWRQIDVAMTGENFNQNGLNVFYPQINWAGNSAGYVGTEFPSVPFVASLLYVASGFTSGLAGLSLFRPNPAFLSSARKEGLK